MTDAEKKWIDEATYRQLLDRHRYGEVGDPMFQGDTGTYYAKVMRERRDADPGGHVAASKAIGWDR